MVNANHPIWPRLGSVSEVPGQWALVLGGSSGIGLATVCELYRLGFHILLVHRSLRDQVEAMQTILESLPGSESRIYKWNKDAVRKESRDELLAEFKSVLPENTQIKVVIHSLANANLRSFDPHANPSLKEDELRWTMEAMGHSFYFWIKDLLASQLLAEGARVLAFTSEGSQKVWKGYGAVSAAKSVLESHMRQMAVELAPYQIRVNCIQAGVTPTPSMLRIPDSKTLLEETVKRNPLGRLTQPEDVAKVAALLCSEEASWINGCIIKADGGESHR